MQFDEQYQYLNLKTGKNVLIQSEFYTIAENQSKEDIENAEHHSAWMKETALEAYMCCTRYPGTRCIPAVSKYVGGIQFAGAVVSFRAKGLNGNRTSMV